VRRYNLRRRPPPRAATHQPAGSARAPPRRSARAAPGPDAMLLFGAPAHVPTTLLVGAGQDNFALSPEALANERELALTRAIWMPRLRPTSGQLLQGDPAPIAPSRREAVSLIAFWTPLGKVAPGPDFPVRLSDPERYLMGPAQVQGHHGARTPTLLDEQILVLMFEGSSEVRPPGGTRTSLARLRLDEQDTLAGARLQDAARIFHLVRASHDREDGDGDHDWFVPLRAMLARMVVGISFEWNVHRLCGFDGAWGHISWLPANGGLRHDRRANREALQRIRETFHFDPFHTQPGAFDPLPAAGSAGGAPNAPPSAAAANGAAGPRGV
jgi:hypothetical protein